MEYSCPICNSKKIVGFLQRTDVPVHQNYIVKTKEEAINTKKGSIKLSFCEDCGFIFNSEFDINKLDYGCNYDNTQDLSLVFKDYVEKEIDFLIRNFDIENKTIIEVGCGKGSFLKKLVEKSKCYAIGFDPSYLGEETLYEGKLKFIKDFYNDKYSNFKADFIISRHVIEHIEAPIQMLREIKCALKNSKNAIVFIETPSVKWILENNILYDFFYEHCSYFEDVSISKALNICGFEVLNVIKEFQNQYMWVVAKSSNFISASNYYKKIEHLKKMAFSYTKNTYEKIDMLKEKLRELTDNGKVSVWGAGAKGATFVNLIDNNNGLIDSVIDINKNKQGYFISGTAHEIINYKDIPYRGIKNIIVMNKNYYNEINEVLNKENIKVNLISGEDLN
ncbi:methyltransferase [Clostridium botulinum]|uniref:class I SAM-dependent methyltransferase n=1 Tax=Clostridium botulinum TaxID=1491 RepID=UPI000C76C9C4|nr:class I SAM-dependent methyltransferase [Clostridium botulinum]AUM88683.1 methyltransferase [Clostridium botulinum]NFO70271.1 methyltransferase domain-containing protein [Clostridium botulinum]